MLPLLHHHLKSCPELHASVLAALSQASEVSARHSLRLAAEMLRLFDRFAAADVNAVPYKGPTLAARCYGNLALRPFRDLDFFIRAADLAQAERVLAADGYRPAPNRTPRQEAAARAATNEAVFWRHDDVVELHWAFAPREFPIPLDFDQVRTKLEPVALSARSVPTLCDEHLLLVLCAHGAKHRWERLEWIRDLAELLRRARSLDLPGALERARTLGTERMVLLGLRLAIEVLDTRLPDDIRRRVLADIAVARLAEQARTGLFHHTPGTLYKPWELRPFQLAARERWRDRLRGSASIAVTLTPGDWEWVRLPDRLYALYYLLRPMRLILKYLRWLRSGDQ